ncbi:IclR family transcriptional regulator domain-containing protein [Tropicimonas isoalkanivorans]|uniref:Transcriptional regulator, IclR family n=1 Tax=Tropicimonas isoalkanivorans TaxID=441112 RepID=A0A1I1MNW9_9RHOB|nr:IclR family transcriptional regulator C-terminal domain-containing protein [Tropicimonas isoalkanivorans]SFC87051.1 transcriptional regulator, IclR family [Tropicimonas isoalkanivorans]
MTEDDIAQIKDAQNFNTSFARGLKVIRAFDAMHPRLSVAGVAERTKLDRAVARRLLLTLVEEGFAKQEGKTFELTAKILTLGYSYLSAMGLDQRLQPYLDELSAQLEQAVSVSVLDGSETIFIARSERVGQIMAYVVRTGLRLSAFSSASGRVLLADLPQDELDRRLADTEMVALTPFTKTDKSAVRDEISRARMNGYCVNEQELEEGLLSVSVPIHGPDGRVRAALNTNCTYTKALQIGFVETAVPLMRSFASQIGPLMH